MLKSIPLYLFFIIMSLSGIAQADKIYRHIPFTLALTASDSLIVDYDFTEKNGIRCTSPDTHFSIDFTYKGHKKSAHLPVILQSAHIPQIVHEQLADVSGQFTLVLKNSLDEKQQVVNCNYFEGT